MRSETPGSDDILDRFEAAWKQSGQANLSDYLPRPDNAHALKIALRLFERDLYYRVQAGEEAPVAERYFQIPGFPLREEQKQALRTQEDSLRQTLSQELAQLFQNIPGHELLTEQGGVTRQSVFDVDSLPILGHGGMGVVYRLKDAALNRDVAIKIIRPDLFPNGRDRFENEAQILAQLEHPGVVPIHSIGCYHDGRPFFTMKVVQGKTLEKLLEARAYPGEDLSRYIDIFEQVCQTVGFAHSKQILHRDLKPGNVMVGAFGEVQVMDWGLGKLLDAEIPLPEKTDEPIGGPGNKTIPGRMLGTYAYAAPEQVKGQLALISQRSDVFGLGAILCEILTGSPPYTSPQLRQKAENADLTEAWSRLAACGADSELVEIVHGCLAKEREMRFADAGEVARRLAEYRAEVQKRLEAARLETEKATARLAAEQKALNAEKQRTRIARWAMGLGLSLAGVAIVAALVIYDLSKKEELAVRKREEAVQITEEAVRRTARLAFGQGQVHCEKGDVPRGLFWFVRSLELGAKDEDLEFAARHQLSLWHRQIPTLVRSWKQPTRIIASAFHPAGKTVFLRSDAGTIHCRDLESGNELWSHKGIDGNQHWFLEPSGASLLIVQTGGNVQILDTTTGKVLREKAMTGKILAVAFRKDTSPPLLALRKEGKIDVSDWEEKPTPCESTDSEPLAATFDAHGGHLLIRSMTSLLCWHVPSKKVKFRVNDRPLLKQIIQPAKTVESTLTTLEDRTVQFKDATISPDGRWILAARADHKIQLWNCDNGTPIFGTGDGVHENVSKVLFNALGTQFLSGSHESLRLWDTNGESLATLDVQRKVTEPFGFLPYGDKIEPTKIYAQGTNIGFRLGRVSDSSVDWFSVPFAQEPLAVQPNGNLALVADSIGSCFLWKLGVTPGPTWLPDLANVYSVEHAPDGSSTQVLFRTYVEKQKKFQHWKLHWNPSDVIRLNKKAILGNPPDDNNLPGLHEEELAPNGRWRVRGDRKGELKIDDIALDCRVGPIVRCGAIKSVRFHLSKAKNTVIIVSGNGRLGTYDIPPPRTESPSEIRRHLENVTGLRMDDAGNLNDLPPEEWTSR